MPVLSVVIPMYDEEDVLPILAERLRPVLDGIGETYEVVAVDDGSSDTTAAQLMGLQPDLAADPGHPPASQLRSPGRPDRRPASGVRPVRGEPRRRPAGPAREDPRDARTRPRQGPRHRVRSPDRPQHRHDGQAPDGGGVLLAHAPDRRQRRAVARRRFPAAEPRHRRRAAPAARTPTGLPAAGAMDRLPQRRGHLRPRGASGRADEVSAAQDGPPRR